MLLFAARLLPLPMFFCFGLCIKLNQYRLLFVSCQIYFDCLFVSLLVCCMHQSKNGPGYSLFLLPVCFLQVNFLVFFMCVCLFVFVCTSLKQVQNILLFASCLRPLSCFVSSPSLGIQHQIQIHMENKGNRSSPNCLSLFQKLTYNIERIIFFFQIRYIFPYQGYQIPNYYGNIFIKSRAPIETVVQYYAIVWSKNSSIYLSD